jgi:hypothetical protein
MQDNQIKKKDLNRYPVFLKNGWDQHCTHSGLSIFEEQVKRDNIRNDGNHGKE